MMFGGYDMYLLKREESIVYWHKTVSRSRWEIPLTDFRVGSTRINDKKQNYTAIFDTGTSLI